MNFPLNLQLAVEALLEGGNEALALSHAQALSHKYRERGSHFSAHRPFVSSYAESLAYVLARMPATYGAAYRAMEATLEACGSHPCRRLLDVGCGTGAASWAADTLWQPESITCVEYSREMREAGQSLMRYGSPPLQKAKWLAKDIREEMPDTGDWVVAAYVLNELDAVLRMDIVRRLWNAAGAVLLLVEPGTPDGFRLLNDIRQVLTGMGAYVLAPCPHEWACPLSYSDRGYNGDWCHFTVRVQRSKAHKLAKKGEAPFEDEKFSYIAFSRQEPVSRGARVLRHPLRHKGHTRLRLCTETGITDRTVTKSDGEIYARIRKAQCGDKLER